MFSNFKSKWCVRFLMFHVHILRLTIWVGLVYLQMAGCCAPVYISASLNFRLTVYWIFFVRRNDLVLVFNLYVDFLIIPLLHLILGVRRRSSLLLKNHFDRSSYWRTAQWYGHWGTYCHHWNFRRNRIKLRPAQRKRRRSALNPTFHFHQELLWAQLPAKIELVVDIPALRCFYLFSRIFTLAAAMRFGSGFEWHFMWVCPLFPQFQQCLSLEQPENNPP